MVDNQSTSIKPTCGSCLLHLLNVEMVVVFFGVYIAVQIVLGNHVNQHGTVYWVYRVYD